MPGHRSPAQSTEPTRLQTIDTAAAPDHAWRRYGASADTEQLLAAADGDDDGAIHGDDVNRAYRAAFVGVVARWSSWCRVVVGEVPGRRRHGGAGLRTCEGAA
jgi:hypothetical protein